MRVTLELEKATPDLLDELVQQTGSADYAEVIKKALATYYTIYQATKIGDRLVFKSGETEIDFDLPELRPKTGGCRMKLKPNTTYQDGHGKAVHIAGTTRKEFDGRLSWWSIEGDHYTEDGLLIRCKLAIPSELGLVYFTTEDHPGNIVSEDESKSARRWWNGVVT